MTEKETKKKTPGSILIPIGWILIALSILPLVVMLQNPHHRDPSIESFMNSPDSLSLAGTIGFIIGSNILSLFALALGIYVVLRKNPRGKPLIFASVVIFIIISVSLFLPSSESVGESQSNSFVITIPQSEYQVTFPHPVKKRIAIAAGIETIAYESEGPDANPYLRAEFINNTLTVSIASNFRAVLENHAKLAGLSFSQITETHDQLGKVGTYSGIKTVGNLTVKVYGKMVLGEYSALNCLMAENLEVFPSEETTRFLGSIKRK